MLTRQWIEVATEGEAGTVGAKALKSEVAAMMAVEVGTVIAEVIAGDMGREEVAVSKADGVAAIAGDSAGVIAGAGETLALPR
jgi:hypothetical protein